MFIRKGLLQNTALFLLSLVICLGLMEMGLRTFMGAYLDNWSERNLMYRYDERLGWFPVENSKYHFTGSRTISVKHNKRGFRDKEHLINSNPRIIFLGDSMVWGYDAEQGERFTDRLQVKLPGISVYNLGVSGYGTDQEYLLLKQQFDYYRPNLVVLVYSNNDETDNTSDIIYDGCFKPYFKAVGDYLELKGVPVPRSLNYFISSGNMLSKSYFARLVFWIYVSYRYPSPGQIPSPTKVIIKNINMFVKSRGSSFVIGLQSRSQDMEKFLNEENIQWVDLSNSFFYPDHGNHWTPEGHSIVYDRFYVFLKNNKYIR